MLHHEASSPVTDVSRRFHDFNEQVDRLAPYYATISDEASAEELTSLIVDHETIVTAVLQQQTDIRPFLFLGHQLASIHYEPSLPSDSVRRLQESIASLVEQNISQVALYLERSPDEYLLENAIYLCVKFFEGDYGRPLPTLADFIAAHVERAVASSIACENMLRRQRLQRAVLGHASMATRHEFLLAAGRMSRSPRPQSVQVGMGFLQEIVSLYDQDDAYRDQANRAIEDRLSSYGFNAQLMVRSWCEASGERFSGGRGSDYILRNVVAMTSLENQRPGICRTLHEEFNIIHFVRYAEEVLLAQYDQHLMPPGAAMPCVVVLVGTGDPRGSFCGGGSPTGHLKSLQSQLSERRIALKVYEVGHRLDVRRALLHAKDPHGAKDNQSPILFVLTIAHGARNLINLGCQQTLKEGAIIDDRFVTSRAVRQMALDLTSSVDPRCGFLAVSCRTGRKGGVVQQLSQKYPEFLCTAPTGVVYVQSLIVLKRHDGGIQIEPQFAYVNDRLSQPRHYLGGLAVAGEQLPFSYPQ